MIQVVCNICDKQFPLEIVERKQMDFSMRSFAFLVPIVEENPKIEPPRIKIVFPEGYAVCQECKLKIEDKLTAELFLIQKKRSVLK